MRYADVFSKQGLMVIFTLSLGLLLLSSSPGMAEEWQDLVDDTRLTSDSAHS